MPGLVIPAAVVRKRVEEAYNDGLMNGRREAIEKLVVKYDGDTIIKMYGGIANLELKRRVDERLHELWPDLYPR